jgi:hypothetical protein
MCQNLSVAIYLVLERVTLQSTPQLCVSVFWIQ